jgi:hypothetical protein
MHQIITISVKKHHIGALFNDSSWNKWTMLLFYIEDIIQVQNELAEFVTHGESGLEHLRSCGERLHKCV